MAEAPKREPIVVELDEPIAFGSEPIVKLTIKPLHAHVWWDFPLKNATFGDFLRVAGKASGQPDEVMRRLGATDMQKVVTAVATFLPNSQATGT